MVVSGKLRVLEAWAEKCRPRNLVCAYPSPRQNPWGSTCVRLFVYTRSAVLLRRLPELEFSLMGRLQAYVPYTFWRISDPRVCNILQGSLVDCCHELFVENFAGIPIMQQHGSVDDNVPAYQSRRMAQLISETKWSSSYAELQGKGHWFDTIMTTASLREFYDQILTRKNTNPSLPQVFTILVANPASMTSRGGIVVDQLITPNQLGRIEVERDQAMSVWTLKTSNILRFHFKPHSLNNLLPDLTIVDGFSITLRQTANFKDEWLVRSADGVWQVRDS